MDTEHERNSTAKAYQLILPERPSQEQLTFFLNNKAKCAGRSCSSANRLDSCQPEPARKRQSDEQAQTAMVQTRVHLLSRRLRQVRRPLRTPRPLTNRQIAQLDAFLKDNGALVRVNDAGREFRQIRAFNNSTFDVTK